MVSARVRVLARGWVPASGYPSKEESSSRWKGVSKGEGVGKGKAVIKWKVQRMPANGRLPASGCASKWCARLKCSIGAKSWLCYVTRSNKCHRPFVQQNSIVATLETTNARGHLYNRTALWHYWKQEPKERAHKYLGPCGTAAAAFAPAAAGLAAVAEFLEALLRETW
eukprot:1161214-Pelagomonas_calceolata.AAC.8